MVCLRTGGGPPCLRSCAPTKFPNRKIDNMKEAKRAFGFIPLKTATNQKSYNLESKFRKLNFLEDHIRNR